MENLDFRVKTRHHNGTVYITLPKKLCKRYNITGEDDEFIDIVIHQLLKKKGIINICEIQVKY